MRHALLYPVLGLAVTWLAPSACAQQASNLAALHRSGQTFLTWDEAGTGNTTESYRVYRHTAEITAGNLPEAATLASIPRGSSRYPAESAFRGSNVYFVIEPLGPNLASNRGLFVYTPHEAGDFWYAVTLQTNGWENTGDFSAANALTAAVAEAEADPEPVLVRTSATGRVRTYTQYMDYHRWNPTLGGYAYNYSVCLPANYSNTVAWPLHLKLVSHGSRYDETETGSWYNRGIQIYGDDPDDTWHYGFHENWDYSKSTHPTSGIIVNYTEQRHLRAIRDVIRDPYYTVDTNRIYAWYSSMGGSGAMTLGFHYPDVFAAVFCWQPVTVYRTADFWRGQDFEKLWGGTNYNLPIESRGPQAGPITNFNGMGVFDWMDHLAMLTNHPGRDVPMFFFHAGKNDGNIEYPSQGAPAPAAFQRARAGFVAMIDPSSHSGIAFADWPTASTTNWDIRQLAFRRDVSFPAFSWASGNDPVPPPAEPLTNFYNKTLEWSCPWNNFAGDIVDTATNYEIVLRSRAQAQYADVTIRRPQAFNPPPGQGIVWQNLPLGSTNPVAMGDLLVDAFGLVTVPRFAVSTNGKRLRLRTDTLADTDADGLRDWYEWARGLNPTSAVDGATVDTDGDGLSNGQERDTGTDPRMSNSYFRITSAGTEAAEWSSTPGTSYSVEYSTNLADWAVAATGIVALDTRSLYTAVPSSNGPRAALRIRLD
ncbi:MAG: hypothetical protein KA248_07275 [Kiritimatiellae bacterium]|nr:hypothetical protein [Kiritimatiellia bacterium]